MDKEQLIRLKKVFGKNLRKIREKKNLSLLDVASQCNIDGSKISKIEHGKFNITLATIIELANGLGIPPSDLLDLNFDEE